MASADRSDRGRAVVAQSELWLLETPNQKRRPVLVVSRDEVIPVVSTVVVRDQPTEDDRPIGLHPGRADRRRSTTTVSPPSTTSHDRAGVFALTGGASAAPGPGATDAV